MYVQTCLNKPTCLDLVHSCVTEGSLTNLLIHKTNPFVLSSLTTGTFFLLHIRLLFPEFYVLFAVFPSVILLNNKLDAQLFIHVYFYSLHVLCSHVPIIRRIIVSMRHLVYVTLCGRPSGMQVSCIPDGHLYRVT